MKKQEDARMVRNTPNMAKLMDMIIPALGGTTVEGFADLIDNSIDASAKHIKILIEPDPTDKRVIKSYTVIDDGVGMNCDILQESHRFGTDTAHAQNDLGVFGVGGTIASISIAKRKTTYSKTKYGSLWVAETDTDWYSKSGFNCDKGCKIRKATEGEKKFFQQYCERSGTIIVLQKLRDGGDYTNPRHLRARMIKEYSRTFGKLLTTRKLSIGIGPTDLAHVEPKDPFYQSDPDVCTYQFSRTYDIDGAKLKVTYLQLNLNLIEDKADKEYGAQGFWVYRCGRLIIRGDSFGGINKRNPLKNSLRVIVEYDEKLDKHMRTSATKNKVEPSQSIKDKIKADFQILVKVINDQRRNNTTPESAEKITKEQEVFSENIAAIAGQLNLPKTPNAPVYRSKSSNGEKADSVKPKGSGKKRGKKQKAAEVRQSRMVPKYKLLSLGAYAPHVVSDFDSDGEMEICINLDSHYVQKNYIKGDPKTQTVLRKEWAAACITEFEYHDLEDTYSIINAYRTQVSKNIEILDKNIK